GRDGGSGMIDSELATIPFITGSSKIEFRGAGWGYTAIAIAYSYSGSGSVVFCSNGAVPGDVSYGAWSACNAVLPDACSGNGCWAGQVSGTAFGTQTRTVTTCQADGTLSNSTETQSCSTSGWYCADSNYCQSPWGW
ncbi:MAG: hypothetical protein NUV83_02485, partial [Candidatus Wolfebacteria bacterium]|nr:hypothetical protein [Candidatus Wolfebacteria bacterium]